MVSNFKFYSGKDINLRKSVSFSAVVGITFGIVALFMLSSTLPEMLFLLFAGYGCSGYVIWLYELAKSKSSGSPPPPAAA
jgi:CDP-diacylglycerol--serine O-phosphatidyltransferase